MWIYERYGWMNFRWDKDSISSIIKSAISHLIFVSIHPFDDGNGRIGRTIADMALEGVFQRGYFRQTEESA